MSRPMISPEEAFELFGLRIPDPVQQTYTTALLDRDAPELNTNAIRAAIDENANNIRYMKNPSKDIILLAMTHDPNSVIHTNCHRLPVPYYIIVNNPELLRRITVDQTKMYKLVEEDGMNIRYMRYQWDGVLVNKALNQNGLALQYVKGKKMHQCVTAVLQNESAIKYVPIEIHNSNLFKIKLLEKYLWYWDQISDTPEHRLKALRRNPAVVTMFKSVTSEQYKLYVNTNSRVISYIPLTPELITQAVMRSSNAVYYISQRQPIDHDTWRLAVSTHPHSIAHTTHIAEIENREQLWELAITLDPEVITYRPVLSLQLQQLAITKDPWLIEYCNSMGFDILMFAVKLEPKLIQKILDLWRNGDLSYNPSSLQWVDLYTAALERDGLLFDFITNTNTDLPWIAIRQNPKALQFIRDPTQDMIDYCIDRDPTTLEYVRDQTLDLCKRAIARDPKCIRFVSPSIIEDYRYLKKYQSL